MLRRGTGLFLAIITIFIVHSHKIYLEAAAGFSVSPALEMLTMKANQPQVVHQVKLTNHTSADQIFGLKVVDFGALNETGGVAFMEAGNGPRSHGLSSWMTLESDKLMVPAGKTALIPVRINNSDAMTPGGHYGAVLATAMTEPAGTVRDGVGLRQALSSLVLVTKEGGVKTTLSLDSQTLNGNFFKLPQTVNQRFHNSGNVHAVPRGVVEVRDPIGRVVRRGVLNDGSTVMLPGTFRRYETEFMKVRSAWWPGYYRVETVYRVDGTDQTRSHRSGFWYMGAAAVWVSAAIGIGVMGCGWWLWRKRHRRRIK